MDCVMYYKKKGMFSGLNKDDNMHVSAKCSQAAEPAGHHFEPRLCICIVYYIHHIGEKEKHFSNPDRQRGYKQEF